jgi:PAS domain S-box-containing protein
MDRYSLLFRFWPTLIVAIFGVISVVSIYRINLSDQRQIIENAEREVINQLNQSLGLTQEPLLSVQSFFASSRFVDRDEFGRFTRPVVERHNAIIALEWIPIVAQSDRKRFETESSIPSFKFKKWDSVSGWHGASEDWAATYYPVYYIEPLGSNQAALGIDLGSYSARREALEAALDTGTIVSSSVIKLAQGGTGLLLFLSLRPLADEPGILTRQSNSLVLAVISIDKLFKDIQLQLDKNQLGLRVVDASSGNLVFKTKHYLQQSKTNIPYHFLNQPWLFEFFKTSGFMTTFSNPLFVGTSTVSLLMVLLVFFYNRKQGIETDRIYGLVKKRGEKLEWRSRKVERLQNRIQLLSGLLPDGLVISNRDGIIEEINSATEKIFGYTVDELTGENVNTLMPNPLSEAHDKYIENYTTVESSHIMNVGRRLLGVRKSGETFPLHINLIEDNTGKEIRFIATMRDISNEPKKLSSQRVINRELSQANKDLEQFAYVASHDLKAPLRAISNLAKWIEEDMQVHMNEETAENMGLLLNRVDRLEHLLDDLLAFSRAGRIEEDIRLVNTHKIIMDIIDLLGNPDQFIFEVSPELPELETVPTAFSMIMRNLISNAIKHHDKPNGRIIIKAEARPDCFVFGVSDDGPGIPDKGHVKVFDLFTSLKSHDEVEGSGMGLSICRRTVDALGGEIWIETTGKEGVTFLFTVPINRSQQ